MDKNTHGHIRPIPPVPPMPPFAPIPPTDGIPHPAPHRHGKPHNHSARFMPMLLHPHIPHHFNFWCNKIIPLAYDDSLSYYEVIAKTVDYLNNMLNDEKMLAINIEEMAQAFCELQNFVNDYFAFYQSKGLIVYDIGITSENYQNILPDADGAQMNTIYRIKFNPDSENNVIENLPESAKPYSGKECLLMNVSNFDLKRVGNEWVEITPDEDSYSTKNNYQLFITDKDIYFRENNGDSWGEWNSIFANWWSSTYSEVQAWVQELVDGIVDDLTALIEAETARATAAENALGQRITDETTRATNAENTLSQRITDETSRATSAENALSVRLVAEYERAAQAESDLDDKIDDEIDRATNAETALSNAITTETSRATTAENNLSSAITAETSRATTAEQGLSNDITAETSRATTAENNLSSAITAETSRATGAENALSARIQNWETDLAQEVTDRRQGDTANANAITAEVTRAQAAESALGNDITAEETRAQTAESALSADITAEETRAQTAESALSDRITGNTTNITNNTTAITNEVSRAQAAEQAIRDGYIPNAGNTKSGNLNIARNDGTISLNSYKGGIIMDGDGTWVTGGNSCKLDVGRDETDCIYLDNGNGGAIYLGDGESGEYARLTLTAVDSGTPTDGRIYMTSSSLTSLNNARFENVSSGHVIIQSTTNGIQLIADITGGHKAYYLDVNGQISNGREIAVKDDITVATGTITSGYIPNAGNATNDVFALQRNNGMTFTAGSFAIKNPSNTTLFNISGTGETTISPNNNVILFPTGNIILSKTNNSNKAYYIKQGESLSSTYEIARLSDVTSAINTLSNTVAGGYIPNGGNSITSGSDAEFDMTRYIFNVNTDSTTSFTASEFIVNMGSNFDVIECDGVGIRIRGYESGTFIDVGQSDSDILEMGAANEIIMQVDSERALDIDQDHWFEYYTSHIEYKTYGQTNDPHIQYFLITCDYDSNNTFDYASNETRLFGHYWKNTLMPVSSLSSAAVAMTSVVTWFNRFRSSESCPIELYFKNATMNVTANHTFDSGGTDDACDVVFENCKFTGTGTIELIYGTFKFINCAFASTVSVTVGDESDVFFDSCSFQLGQNTVVSDRRNQEHKVTFDGCAFGNLTIDGGQSLGYLRNIVVKNCFVTAMVINTGSTSANIDNILICGNRIVSKTVNGNGTITTSYMFNNIEGV